MKSNDSKLIKKDYLKKINLINRYNKAYYKNSKPIITDFEYDNLKIEISSNELPILDGSSKIYLNAINKIGLKIQNKKSKEFIVNKIISFTS